MVGTAQKLVGGSPGALAGFSFTSFTCKSRTSALPIDMNGSATEESAKILKHKPKQFSSPFIQVGKTIFAVRRVMEVSHHMGKGQ